MVIALTGLSRISRNGRKLLRVVEFPLARRAAVLTTNYLLTAKEVSVRPRELVRPDSVDPMDGFRKTCGLTGSHRKIAEAHIHQVSQRHQRRRGRCSSAWTSDQAKAQTPVPGRGSMKA
jgi:hypothetical protein